MKIDLPVQPDRIDIERKRLLELDIEEVLKKAQIKIEQKKTPTEYLINVPLFSSFGSLSMPEGKIECNETGFLSFLMRLLLLHYLCNSSAHNPSGVWVNYCDLPDGIFYASTLTHNFQTLAERFGKNRNTLSEFEKVCTKLGGEKVSHGDSAFVIKVFPKVSVLVIIYLGDEEFPPNAKVLIDEKVLNFLQIDFVKLLIIEVINTIIRVAKRVNSPEEY